MLKSIKIKNFKKFENLEVNDFSRINLFVGANNCGKTCLLKAIFFSAWPSAGSSFNLLNLQDWIVRDSKFIKNEYGVSELYNDYKTRHEIFKTLFYNFDWQKKIFLKSIFNNNKQKEEREITATLPSLASTDRFNFTVKRNNEEFKIESFYITKDGLTSELRGYFFNFIKKAKKESKIIEILKKIQPNLTNIEFGRQDIINLEIGLQETVPLYIMGDGFIRLLDIALIISNCNNGILLIDEIENSFYTDNLKNNWKILNEASKEFNTQIFATTHSWENIQAFGNNIEDDDIAVYRLDEDRIVRFDKKDVLLNTEQGYYINNRKRS